MKRYPLARLLAVALFIAPLLASAATETEKAPVAPAAARGYFTRGSTIDWKQIVPPPPEAGSLAALTDIEIVLQVQASRTPADIAWAQLIEPENIYADYRDVLGPWFAQDKLPVFAGFLRQVATDISAAGAKGIHPFRPRPPAVDPAVKPCVRLPESSSYPSGHSLRGYVWGAVLADIFTDQQAELEARAHRIAWGRVIGGVHFPTDTVASRLAAQALMTEMRKNPEYRAAIEKCRAEAAAFLLKKAA